MRSARPTSPRRNGLESTGAGSKNRTRDLLITNQLLYLLSYAGNSGAILPLWRRLALHPRRVQEHG